MGYVAGIDLGATNLRAAVADAEGNVVSRDRRPTPRGPAGIDVTEATLDLLRSAAAKADVPPSAISAVGIGSIGPLDLTEGTIESPANLPDTIDRIPLIGPISELVESDRIYLHNDTTVGVIGERFFSDRNPDNMVYLTISSGIGAGVIVDGHVLSGWDGNVGEVGHYVVDAEGRRTCGCGLDGHWEAYCSGNNIPGYTRQLAEDYDGETSLPLDDPEFSAADLFAHAEEDPFARSVVDRLAELNTAGVANLVHDFAPLVVYVGGAVALENPRLVVDEIRDRLPERVISNIPDVQLTTLGSEVVLKGAIASALTGGTGERAAD